MHPISPLQQSINYTSFIQTNSEKIITIEANPKDVISTVSIVKLNENKQFPQTPRVEAWKRKLQKAIPKWSGTTKSSLTKRTNQKILQLYSKFGSNISFNLDTRKMESSTN